MTLVCAVLTLSGEATAGDCVAPHYKVIALPLHPASMNDRGEVAGTTAEHRAAYWSLKLGRRDIALPKGFETSDAVDINSSGHVLGVASDRAGQTHHAFIFANGVLRSLAGNQLRGYHISDSDVVAGESLIEGNDTMQPVVWASDRIQSLGGCCGGSSKSINRAGNVTGDSYDVQGHYHAFYWTLQEGMQVIGPPDRYSSAIAMNNRGAVVIQSFPGVFLYSAKHLSELSLAPKFASHPHAINDCGVLVGSFGPYSDADRAFVWEKSVGFQDLNALIPQDSGWKLERAVAINSGGEIVGIGDLKGDDDRGFLLVPIR